MLYAGQFDHTHWEDIAQQVKGPLLLLWHPTSTVSPLDVAKPLACLFFLLCLSYAYCSPQLPVQTSRFKVRSFHSSTQNSILPTIWLPILFIIKLRSTWWSSESFRASPALPTSPTTYRTQAPLVTCTGPQHTRPSRPQDLAEGSSFRRHSLLPLLLQCQFSVRPSGAALCDACLSVTCSESRNCLFKLVCHTAGN